MLIFRAKKLICSHLVLLGCAAVGCIGGFFGFFAGVAAGIFIELVAARIREEKKVRSAIADGIFPADTKEPFAGAAYLCALGVYCAKDADIAARNAKKCFEPAFSADWQTLCRAAGEPTAINGDFICECLASTLLRQMKNEFAPLKPIFSFLYSVELHWNEQTRGTKPSEYLARLLDYTVLSDEIEAAYRTLGLPKNATTEEIKSAHRRLAAQFHPDNTTGNRERFLEIQAAYELIIQNE